MSRFQPATLVLLQFRITYQPEHFNQILATADLGHRTLRHHGDRMNTKTRLRARATCSICAGASSITEISLFLTFPLKSQEEHRAAVETSPRRPSISDQTHSPTILRSLAEHFLTHLSTFSGAPPPPPLRSPTKTSLSIKSPPERSERRKEGERTLIWLCNTVQFAIGQWNSISFPPSLVNIHLKSLHRHCLPLALSRWYSSSAAAFSEDRIRLQQERLKKERTLDEFAVLQRNKPADTALYVFFFSDVFLWLINSFSAEPPSLISDRVIQLNA